MKENIYKTIEEIFDHLDFLFEEKKIEEIEPFLQEQLENGIKEEKIEFVIPIVNELIGFYRDTSQYEKALFYCKDILTYMNSKGLENTIHYATTCLNIANAYRAAGKWDMSHEFYDKVSLIYKQLLTDDDVLWASFHNNLSLLYQEMNDFKNAVCELKKAENIIKKYNDPIKLATTYSNLAASLLQINEVEEAKQYIEQSISIYVQDGERDFHYGAALSVIGELMFRLNKYEEAKMYYKKSLNEIKLHIGENENYQRTMENLRIVEKLLEENKEKLAYEMLYDFYEEYGRPMICNKFPEFINKIAIGRVGYGSECFGFSDEYSMDHDFGPGFMMWVTKETYHKIGEELELEYNNLPMTFRGIKRQEMYMAKGRYGVHIIEDFYRELLGTNTIPYKEEEWECIQDENLALATNGCVLVDEEQIFSHIREHLCSYYPEKVWKKKMATQLSYFSQYGQYNYERMLKRGDYITSSMCIQKFTETTLKLLYLLNKKYYPYYKWLYKGTSNLEDYNICSHLISIQKTSIFEQEKIVEEIAIIAKKIRHQLDVLGLIMEKEDDYLEHYSLEMIQELKKEAYVDEIVSYEFSEFDHVKNIGGRASCQDDRSTFSIMRKSQYLTWPSSLILLYLEDLKKATKVGWNLITEKYARMMETTAHEEFLELKDQLPVLSKEKILIIEEIVKIQLQWMEEFAEYYPNMAQNCRVIYTKDDSKEETSFETYLRGELSTYSDQTLEQYGRFIVSYLTNNKNLTKDIMNHTAKLYGYKNLEDAEEKLAKFSQ
ncbi:MAG: DUF4125 family protein [Lachnospiraceae bacterium]